MEDLLYLWQVGQVVRSRFYTGRKKFREVVLGSDESGSRLATKDTEAWDGSLRLEGLEVGSL